MRRRLWTKSSLLLKSYLRCSWNMILTNWDNFRSASVSQHDGSRVMENIYESLLRCTGHDGISTSKCHHSPHQDQVWVGAYFSPLGRWSNTERLCELILIRASHLSDRGMFSHTDNMLAAHNDLTMLIKLLKSEANCKIHLTSQWLEYSPIHNSCLWQEAEKCWICFEWGY